MASSQKVSLQPSCLPMSEEGLKTLINGYKYRQEADGIAEAELYPRILLSAEEDGKLLKACRRGYQRFDLNAHVAATIISGNENLCIEIHQAPPALATNIDNIRMVLKKNKYCIRRFCSLLPTSEETGEDVMVLLVPIVSSTCSVPILMKGLLIVSEKLLCVVDVMDRDAVGVCNSFLLGNSSIIKCVMDAAEDLPLIWTMLGCAPEKIFCVTSAAFTILQHFGVEPQKECRQINGRILGMNFEQYFGIQLDDVTVASENALQDMKLVTIGKQKYELLGLIVHSVRLLTEVAALHWTKAFKWDIAKVVKRMEPSLTKEMGVNFWSSLVTALSNELDLRLFLWSHLYQNFGSLPKIGVPRDATYLDVLPIYNKFEEIMKQGKSRREGFTTDGAFKDEISFGNYLANVLNGHAIAPWRTDVGTLGEMKRRLKLYLNWS